MSAPSRSGSGAPRLGACLLVALIWLLPELSAGIAAAPQASPDGAGARVGAEGLRSLARDDDAVVVSVGDVDLRRSDVFRVLDLATPARSAEVIRQMVLTTAAALDAAREGLDVPAAELAAAVERALAEQKASFALEVDEDLPLEEYLRLRHGLAAEDYRAEVRRMVLSSMLLERAVRLDLRRTARDELQLILLEDADLARSLAEQLRAGASFAVLARKHSLHPSAPQGGDLPPLPVDEVSPLVDGRAGLQPGEFLGPADLPAGSRTLWRLLRLAERHPADGRSWSELRGEIEAELRTRPLNSEELALFEARVADRYRVSRPKSLSGPEPDSNGQDPSDDSALPR